MLMLYTCRIHRYSYNQRKHPQRAAHALSNHTYFGMSIRKPSISTTANHLSSSLLFVQRKSRTYNTMSREMNVTCHGYQESREAELGQTESKNTHLIRVEGLQDTLTNAHGKLRYDLLLLDQFGVLHDGR